MVAAELAHWNRYSLGPRVRTAETGEQADKRTSGQANKRTAVWLWVVLGWWQYNNTVLLVRVCESGLGLCAGAGVDSLGAAAAALHQQGVGSRAPGTPSSLRLAAFAGPFRSRRRGRKFHRQSTFPDHRQTPNTPPDHHSLLPPPPTLSMPQSTHREPSPRALVAALSHSPGLSVPPGAVTPAVVHPADLFSRSQSRPAAL
jgi:hypothetical protein